jgi:hypothetical protein
MAPGCHPLSNEIDNTEQQQSEEEKQPLMMNKGRKRGLQQDKSSHVRLQHPQQQRKRTKNDKISTNSSP